MSYDVYFEKPRCSHCGREETTEAQENYTSNTSFMWDEAGAPIREMDGLPAYFVAPLFERAARHIRENMEHYEKQNPPNGWGDAEGTIKFLWRLAGHCAEHPETFIRIWR